MSTAVTATKIGHARLGPGLKVVTYTVSLPTSWTLAGVAIDLSADLDYVYGAVFGASGAVADHAMNYNLIGTIVTTAGKGQGGIAAAGVSLVAHRDAATEVVFPGVPNSTNVESVNDLCMVVFGE